MIYKCTLRFCGTRYHGWQVQQNALTVSSVFQDAVEAVFHYRYDIKGSARTDAGVHANGYVVAIYTDKAIEPAALVRALNVHLPKDVAVLEATVVPDGFHPRYDAIGKRYCYHYLNSPQKDPFLAERVWQVGENINWEAMNRAASAIIGTHDFSSFCAAGGSIPPEERTRTLWQCELQKEGNQWVLSVAGDGFLYHMVRIIAGTLLEVGKGKRSPESMASLLEARDRTKAGITAPPDGLYLDEVFYEEVKSFGAYHQS